ncbi:MAG TPA: tRNA pseudouridine(55) synthase TruB [Spirochaetota bacterium]|nr:tRNA pseudouridine(55) synthase TruB [Spirochaetota bacterium]
MPFLRAAVLPVDKPVGMTSFDVLRILKKVFRRVRIGHAGTLDPAASGLLLVCFGAATRLVSWFHTFPKTYRADVLFGVTTDSDDLDGSVTARNPVPAGLEQLLPALYDEFRGEIRQLPPAVSAVKTGGKRAYALVRAGIAPELRERSVTVFELNERERGTDRVALEIICSSGTYIRSIARDMGSRLGCGACLAGLRRTSLVGYRLEEAWKVSENPAQEDILPFIRPLESCFVPKSSVALTPEESNRVAHGVLPWSLLPQLGDRGPGPLVLLNPAGQILAVIAKEGERWQFIVVLPPNEAGGVAG